MSDRDRVIAMGNKKKNVIKKLSKIVVAIIISFFIVNMITFFFHRSSGWIDVYGGPVAAIFEPNTVIVSSTEGYGVNKMDNNGLSNPSVDLSSEGYILSLGSSITRCSQLPMEQHFTSLLNEMLNGSNNSLKVYNLGQDGATFNSISERFLAAVREFPNSKAVIMEFCILGIDQNDIANGFESEEWIPNSIRNVNITTKQKITFFIKKYIPFAAYLISSVLPNLMDDKLNESEVNTETAIIELDEYESYYRQMFSYMRSVYNETIIIVYIPKPELTQEGIYFEKRPEIDLMFEIAQDYDIDVLDARESFSMHYDDDYTFPTGFWNTYYGPGHMNREGHKIIAEELYKKLKGINI